MTDRKPFEKIYDLVARIPEGKVATYGQIARLTGVIPRVVGYAMNGNKDMKRVPCHRVIASDGSLHGYASGVEVKRQKLQKEGVLFAGNKVDLSGCLYTF